jgi:hypothetical protein
MEGGGDSNAPEVATAYFKNKNNTNEIIIKQK